MKAKKIVIECEDGKTYTADGDAAATIWQWYQTAELQYLNHGAIYNGPSLTVTEAPGK